MEPTLQPVQQIPPEIKDQYSSTATHRVGLLSLGLIFAASAIVTTTYLQNTGLSHEATPPTAQAAILALPADDSSSVFASTTLDAQAAFVLDVSRHRVLYTLNPDVQLPLASITKVPMALVVSEVLRPDTHLTIPLDTAPKGSLERLAKDDIWRISDVIDFTLAASSNAGATILADAADDGLHAQYPLAPRGGATLWRMNDLARELGLTKTYFLNVSGLDESTTQSGAYGSARDVATLFAYAASTSPEIFAATTQPSFSLLSINGARTIAINTDKVLDAIPGIVMGKTGYTDLAGGNLAIVFNAAPGHTIVAVVLGSTEQGRFTDMKKLIAGVSKTLSH